MIPDPNRLDLLRRRQEGRRVVGEVSRELSDILARRVHPDRFLTLETTDRERAALAEETTRLEAGVLCPERLVGVCSGDWAVIDRMADFFAQGVAAGTQFSWFHALSGVTGALSVALEEVRPVLQAVADPEGEDLLLRTSDGRSTLKLAADDNNGHADLSWEFLGWTV